MYLKTNKNTDENVIKHTTKTITYQVSPPTHFDTNVLSSGCLSTIKIRRYNKKITQILVWPTTPYYYPIIISSLMRVVRNQFINMLYYIEVKWRQEIFSISKVPDWFFGVCKLLLQGTGFLF